MVKLAVAAAAVAAGMIASPLAAGTANAATTYTWSSIDRCATTPDSAADCFELGTYSTYSQTQVWINGTVYCHPYKGSVKITWCGVGGGNGTGALNIGDNFTPSGVSGSYYERINIFAGGAGCGTYGSNSDTNGISHWWNDRDGPGGGGVVCESHA
jgi:hypothetical protein